MQASQFRVLELYCGIGGFAAAVGERAEVAAALDIHRGALELYRLNFPHPTVTCTLESLSADRLRRWQADLWWMSPPCQPYTRRGLRRDSTDPRARSFLALISRLEEMPPPWLALENVPGFRGSRVHESLRSVLERLGYRVLETLLCPTALGVPNRRRRFYLVAGREPLRSPAPPAVRRRPLSSYLDPRPEPDLTVDAGLVRTYERALDIVDADDSEAVSACFTSAYGRSPVRSGSYLKTADGARRFSPREILRLLGFPESFVLPDSLPREAAWRLAGNSLSVPAVRHVVSAIPALATLGGTFERQRRDL